MTASRGAPAADQHPAARAPRLLPWTVLLVLLAVAVAAAGVAWGRIRDDCYYLTAAHFILGGHLPYRDFFFPQAPLAAYWYTLAWLAPGGHPLLAGRLLSALCALAALALAAALARRWAGGQAALLALASLALSLGTMKTLTEIHALPPAALLVTLGACLLLRGGRALAFGGGLLLGAAVAARLTALPGVALGLLLAWRLPSLRPRAPWALLGALAGGASLFLPLWLAAGDRLTWAVLEVAPGRAAAMGPLGLLLDRTTALADLAQLHFPALLALAYLWPRRRQLLSDPAREEVTCALGLVGGVVLAHLLMAGSMLTYHAFVAPLGYAAAAALFMRAAPGFPHRGLGVFTRRRALVALYALLLAAACLRLVNRYQPAARSPLVQWQQLAAWWHTHLPAGARPFTLEESVVAARLLPVPSCAAGHFSYFPRLPEAAARHYRVNSYASVRQDLWQRRYQWLVLPEDGRCFVFDASINHDREQLAPQARSLLRLAASRYLLVARDQGRLVLRRPEP